MKGKFPMKLALTVIALLALSTLTQAQTGGQSPTPPSATKTPAPMSNTTDKFDAERIPINSKVYIGSFVAEGDHDTGFGVYLAAAIRKKNVPVILVTNLNDADFEISGTADKKSAGLAKKILLGDFHATTSASIQMVNTKTGVVAYADSSHRDSAARGMRSSAEKLAKYLKKKIEDDEKKSGKLGR
jgi:hypothetical protein